MRKSLSESAVYRAEREAAGRRVRLLTPTFPRSKYDPKPWYFKVGRLNMLSGEPLGVYVRTPWFEWRAFNWGVGFL